MTGSVGEMDRSNEASQLASWPKVSSWVIGFN